MSIVDPLKITANCYCRVLPSSYHCPSISQPTPHVPCLLGVVKYNKNKQTQYIKNDTRIRRTIQVRGVLNPCWWNLGGTLVEPRLMDPWWNLGGALVEPRLVELWWIPGWWSLGGTQVLVLWWNPGWWNFGGTQSGGTLVEPRLVELWWNRGWWSFGGTQAGGTLVEPSLVEL